MIMKYRLSIFFIILLSMDIFFSLQAFPQPKENSAPNSNPKELTLFHAVMCEEIKEYVPRNPAIVFSITIGKIFCYTSFDPVPEKTFIYHKWFHRDKISTTVKLNLKSPRWSTFSRIRLREADKGPWRVEITDNKGTIFRILRFSITD